MKFTQKAGESRKSPRGLQPALSDKSTYHSDTGCRHFASLQRAEAGAQVQQRPVKPELACDLGKHNSATALPRAKDGHGFGLHSGALAAKKMGGTLIAQSDGPGKGASHTFLAAESRADLAESFSGQNLTGWGRLVPHLTR